MATEIGTDYGLYEQLGLTQQTEEEKPANQLAQEDFLELMITELTHQDPFNPLDNTDMAAQFANFSTVTGIDQLNQSFEDLQTSLVGNQALQAAGLVGKQVMVPGSVGQLESGGEISGRVELDGAAGSVTARIYATSGELVRELNLGSHTAGDVAFTWDGLTDKGDYAPAGEYRIEVQADVDGETVAPSVQIAAPVESVELNNGDGLVLNVLGLGAVDFADVSAIA